MIANMDAWVRSNTAPPASSYPKIADGTSGTTADNMRFPAIPGVNKPHEANAGTPLGLWSELARRNSDPSAAKVGEAFPVLVPQVDADGNERDGVRLAGDHQCRWRPTRAGICAILRLVRPISGSSFEASYIPFPRPALTAKIPAIHASPSRNAIRVAKIIYPGIAVRLRN